ncbi:cytochrome o ubiquinol oxidase subunit III [Buchnera aphidicola (Aphis helianthi)]|uniref:Cytochrome bo(3) ubiquinol oxidase subunit 3 n=1 Tax=Buchnera aphidicola (Aphis helianthi) TaxID=2315802 RepID=A0A4D6XKL1_9GAMM|nr:cytochrome o ubiquinol oxidase subunit III [Buchnera aphidicola]QCI17272.1 cytochrome o ubiquinol oxidase subunit III [Buchnera aphidicola (Aphis helianthi)]
MTKKTKDQISYPFFKKKDEKLHNNKLFGLWIYLMSDCIMFAVLFAVYAIIFHNLTINFISYKIFNLSSIFFETFILLLSSFTCAMLTIEKDKKNIKMIYFYLIITFFLGVIFLILEANEFYNLFIENYTPNQHAFFSIFFTIVGIHGIHIIFGLILLLSIIYQIFKLGLTNTIQIRISCFSLFWHFLDIIWVCIFTFIYLNGVI